MKPASEWRDELIHEGLPPHITGETARSGEGTLKSGNVYLHSRYDPSTEAARLVESASLDAQRPVLVVGLGLGYHVLELLRRGFDTAVLEPEAGVAAAALQGPLRDVDFPLAIGPAASWKDSGAFCAFASRNPQPLVHPPSARLYPDYLDHALEAVGAAGLKDKHLSIAVVGPMYGGSLPISRYLARALNRMGHRALLIENEAGWELFQRVRDSVRGPQLTSQLNAMLTTLLAEWTFARVAEFRPEICIVLAQAPVNVQFPQRLRSRGIVSAYWFVENWRHMSYWSEIAPQYDAFFHIQPGGFEDQLDRAGCRHHAYVQTACDPDAHCAVSLSPEERRVYECDLSFAGAGYRNRLELFKGLTDYHFKIWGVEWHERALARALVGGEEFFSTETFMKIVAGSKINLNLHSSATHDGVDPTCDAVNPRVFEIAAAGGFQLCDPCGNLASLFDLETELPSYTNLKELREKIDFFLAHPQERIAIAKRAQQRVLSEHTYEHRAKAMLDFLFARHGATILRRGVREQRTVGEMAKEVGDTSELGRWLSTLPENVLFTHESLKPFLKPTGGGATYAEEILTYLTEVRSFAETLLKEKR